ncbi:hypothetical protein BDW60DRAFT_227073 [Aspergillus nidulans var. acristatus]
MHFLSILSALALTPGVLSSSSTVHKGLVARDGSRGNDTITGLGARKQALLDAGGNTRDLAIAMLETRRLLTIIPTGDGKTGDSTNFGIFKQNWYMLRHSASDFLGQTVDQVANGAILNSDLGKDVQARHEGEEKYGYETWFAGHRNGESGVQNPGTDDIKAYIDAVAWIQQQIESDKKYQSDDTRFWVDVHAI